MDGEFDREAMLAALAWQVELGAVDAIGDVPVDRFEVKPEPKAKPATTAKDQHAPVVMPELDAVAEAKAAAGAAATLEALAAAQEAFPHCELKRGARNFVFADGRPEARVMVIGEGPGAEEDAQGKPFVGRSGQLLDRMFAAIGLARDAVDAEAALYITNVVPWRPPQNRDPEAEELAMMRPFVERHIELAGPELIVLMGNPACGSLLDKRGITRLRGNWHEFAGVPVMPMFHPSFLLRKTEMKRLAWADLLTVRARLEGAG
ncbi:uracil-DNA glycosylase [Oceanicola sp. 502str15]|uniref:uracil-DNA glycosylase n=1 Tax=Oceanicola sp. 502str15 TaxID=2696061 RepID=UPI0020955139|nr:uracil-DNA glycosylase [Oceanicola sp. 502str15]MCO6384213.1 uracil-DNA glycosylase [Oceanicola sp. 502str15]